MDKPAPKPPKEKPLPPPPPPEPLIKEISASKYEKEVRPKKELSEKQKANLEKLIERNKAKAVERRAVVKEVIPESIPEDKVLVRVKPKRIYNRKPKEEAPKNVIVEPSSNHTPASSETEYTESESEPEVKPRKRRERKQAPKKKIVPKYSYDTETTTADEDSSDSDEDDYKVVKYQVKAEKRMKALEKIDKRLNQLHNNPYQSREMSVF
jgi:thymidylate synthase